MTYRRPVLAAIFDMDGLLIDSEPLWDRAELEVFASLNVDISRRHELPDTLGLRIDQTVRMWYEALPWNGPDQAEVTQRIIARALALVEETRPLLRRRAGAAAVSATGRRLRWPRRLRWRCWNACWRCSTCVTTLAPSSRLKRCLQQTASAGVSGCCSKAGD